MGATVVIIPGEPVAQGRGRAFGFKRADGGIGVRVFDPKKSRDWKATAQQHMVEAMGSSEPFDGPIRLVVEARFTLPKSSWRKREPVGRTWHCKRPDGDNVLKAVKDAAKGVLWLDDCQVCDAQVIKLNGAQGEAPRISVQVEQLA